MRPGGRALGWLTILWLAVHGVAWACTCLEPPPVDEAFAESPMVFYGEVDVVGSSPLSCGFAHRSVRMTVVQAFKGVEDGESVVVQTNQGNGSCGLDLQRGEHWLLYSFGDDFVGLCGRSRIAAAGDPEFDELEALAAAAP